MEKSVATLDKGAICSSWNYCGQRLSTGMIDGSIAIYDTSDPASSSFTSTFKFKVNISIPVSYISISSFPVNFVPYTVTKIRNDLDSTYQPGEKELFN